MKLLKLCRTTFTRMLLILVIISSLHATQAFSQETEDSQVFIAGFNAYQQKDYGSSIEKLTEVLRKHPNTPLRDMTLFWLARSYYKIGNQQEAARNLSRFSRDYPDNPLKSTVEDELLTLTARFERGETLPVGAPPVKQLGQSSVQIVKAEKERIAVARGEEARQAAVVAETARTAAQKQTEENADAEKREQAAAQKTADNRKATLAAAEAEAARLKTLRLTEERAASEKMAQEQILLTKATQEKAEREKTPPATIAEPAATEQTAGETGAVMAAAAAESAQLSAVKQAEEQQTRMKAEQEKIAAQKAAEQRELAQRAAAKAAGEKAAEQAQAKAEFERREAVERAIATLRAEAEMEASRIATQKAERERIIQVKIKEARQAAAAAETARLAALKAEADRLAAEQAANEEKARRLVTQKAEEARLEQQKLQDERTKAAKRAYREKAIAQYKAILDTYPKSAAAITSAAKLRELGIAVALPPAASEPAQSDTTQVLKLEVAQFAGFEFNLPTPPPAFNVGVPATIPFEVVNRGNGADSFDLFSTFPASYRPRFASAAAPEKNIDRTPTLEPAETFRGVIEFVIPPNSIDGLRIAQAVKIASRLMGEASQSHEIQLVASAPLLRAIVRAENSTYLPGGKVAYRVSLLNVGSTTARDVSVRVRYPSGLEPSATGNGFKKESSTSVALDDVVISSGESREFTVPFQLKEGALAGEDLTARVELFNKTLGTSAVFVSNSPTVAIQRGVVIRSATAPVITIPGQTIAVPLTVVNTGNIREKFTISSKLAGGESLVVYHDLNRDGIRQASEKPVKELGPLAPGEEASLVAEVKTATTVSDGSKGTVQVSISSAEDSSSSATGTAQLIYSRPVLKLATSSHSGQLKPGDITSFDLTITNNGSNLARVVVLQSIWPELLELVASEPTTSSVAQGTVTWRFTELGAGERRNIRVSFRVKPGTGVGKAIQVRNSLTYEDQLGNRY